MIELAGEPPDRGLTDLSIIGVPAEAQNQLPTLNAFPSKFSNDGRVIWAQVIELIRSGNTFINMGSRDLVWHFAIQEYLRLCTDLGVFPFKQGNTDTTRNEFIQDFVRRGRNEVVQYADFIALFKRVTVRKVYREYVRHKNGVIIRSWADLFPIRDGVDFRKWLVQSPWPRFIKRTPGFFVRRVRPNVNMWIRYTNDSRIVVGYDIKVIGTINIPGNKAPTRKDVDAFIDQTIFYPTIRARRFADVRNRLF